MPDFSKIVGGNGVRAKNDFYPTPPECTVALLNFLEQRQLIKQGDCVWEPACGDYAITKVLINNGYKTVSTDIVHGRDFMATDLSAGVDWIITNPPFSLAREFVERSAHLGRPFALLLKSQFWHAASRVDLFRRFPPAFVLPLTWRPDFTGKGASLLDMIWVVWHKSADSTRYIPLSKPKY